MQQHWILIDARQNKHLDAWKLSGKSIGWPELTVQLERLRGGLRDGVDQLTVTLGDTSWRILPTRGMSLWDANVGDWRVGWKSPTAGPVHPRHVSVEAASGLGWLDGFDELLVRCGLESNRAPDFDEHGRLRHGLHGRIANLPAQKLELLVDPEEKTIEVVGQVDEVRFHFSKLRLTSRYRWNADPQVCEVTDTIENLSASSAEAQLLYHINLGTPLLEEHATFQAPVKRLVPRNEHAAANLDHWKQYPSPTPGFAEQVYFLELHRDAQQQTLALLQDRKQTRAVCLRFNVDELPCFSLWKNPTAIEDGYVTGIEPATNFPNPRSFEVEKGRVIGLPPRGTYQSHLRLELLTDPTAINERLTEVQELQDQGEAVLEPGPNPEWCAD